MHTHTYTHTHTHVHAQAQAGTHAHTNTQARQRTCVSRYHADTKIHTRTHLAHHRQLYHWCQCLQDGLQVCILKGLEVPSKEAPARWGQAWCAAVAASALSALLVIAAGCAILLTRSTLRAERANLTSSSIGPPVWPAVLNHRGVGLRVAQPEGQHGLPRGGDWETRGVWTWDEGSISLGSWFVH